MIKFIIDTQLPPKLSEFFSKLGFDSKHTTDFFNGHLLSDSEIIEIAKKESRIIITKDKDFYDSFFIIGSPPSILLLKIGNVNNDTLIHLISSTINRVVSLFDEGAGLVILTINEVISF